LSSGRRFLFLPLCANYTVAWQGPADDYEYSSDEDTEDESRSGRKSKKSKKSKHRKREKDTFDIDEVRGSHALCGVNSWWQVAVW
jgi:hypothetical protein